MRHSGVLQYYLRRGNYDAEWSFLQSAYPDINGNKFLADNAVAFGGLEDQEGIFINRGLSIKSPGVQRHIPFQCVLILGAVDTYEFYETFGANMNKLMEYDSIQVESCVSCILFNGASVRKFNRSHLGLGDIFSQSLRYFSTCLSSTVNARNPYTFFVL